MLFYLWYEYGSCNYGDHETCLEDFDTLEAAQARF